MLSKILRRKRGADLSMNVIIIAALALTVLIVLIYIFTANSRNFVSGTKSCESKKGTCMRLSDCNSDDGIVYRNTNCDDNNPEGMDKSSDNYEVCCVKLI